jgi:prepilin-type processing-associated H-X9-DG protein
MCASNLRQIGQAILLYCNENNSTYPDTLGTLLLTEDITAEVFICPLTNVPRSTAPTTRAQADEIDSGKCTSYIYLGKGMNARTVPADAVIAYEPLSNHGGDGTNVLFGDGHVEFLNKTEAQTILTQVQSGARPVRWPTTQRAGR